jgi:hypothetical protein
MSWSTVNAAGKPAALLTMMSTSALLHKRIHRLGIGHVSLDEPRVGADGTDGVFTSGRVTARDDDGGAFAGEQPRGLQSDARRSAVITAVWSSSSMAICPNAHRWPGEWPTSR